MDFKKLKTFVLYITSILIFSLASFFLWHLEIVYIKGWDGLKWLSGYFWSTIPICVLTSISIIITLYKKEKKPKRNYVKLFILTFIILFISCELSKSAIGMCHFVFYPYPFIDIVLQNIPFVLFFFLDFCIPLPAIFLSLLSIIILSAGIFISINSLSEKIPVVCIPLLAFSPFVILSLSILTIKIFPAYYYNDYIHAFKYGYVVFWCSFIIPLFILFSTIKNSKHW